MNLVYDSESVTHLHLLSVLVTEINKKKSVGKIINILDAGCGNGHLTVFLQVNLVAFFPEMELHIYGYDIADHGVQAKDFFLGTAKWCEEKCPDIKWDERLKLISHDQSWPFESEFFDFVVSNQVLEHVWNHRQFFSEHSRILKKQANENER